MATARAHQAIDALPTSSSPSSTRPRPLLVVGSINQDVVLKVSRLPSPGETLAASSMEFFPGGKGCNQAAAAARLGHATSMIGRIGDDAAGQSLRAALEGAGVETSGVVVSTTTATTAAGASGKGEKQPTQPPPPTGTAVIMLQPDGENSIVIVGGANVEGWGQALLLGGESGSGGGGKRGDGGSNDDDDDDDDNATTPPPPVSVSPEFGALLLQREVPEAVNAAYARAAVASGVRVVLDAGGVDAPISEELLGCVHTLSPNETELARLLRGSPSNGGGGDGGDSEDNSGGDGNDGQGQGPRTESDAEVEAAARLLLSRSPASLRAVLVKRGGKGSMLVERSDSGGGGGGVGGGEDEDDKGKGQASSSSASSSPSILTRVVAQPAARVAAVVDTTGAGDCFTAAYCVAWLREEGGIGGAGESAKNAEEEKDPPEEQQRRKRIQQRLRFATAAAALCVSRAGALPSMPSLAEAEGFLESGDGFR